MLLLQSLFGEVELAQRPLVFLLVNVGLAVVVLVRRRRLVAVEARRPSDQHLHLHFLVFAAQAAALALSEGNFPAKIKPTRLFSTRLDGFLDVPFVFFSDLT